MTGIDDDGNLGYFDGQYIIPQMFWYSALSAAGNEGSAMDKGSDLLSTILAPFNQGNIFTMTVAGGLMNRKASGGDIYNPESDDFWEKAGKVIANTANDMFKPGIYGTYKKAITDEQANAYGSVVKKNDWLWSLAGVRLNHKDIKSEGFGRDQFAKFAQNHRGVMKDVSKAKLADMTDEERVKATAKVNKLRKKSNVQLSRTVRMLRTDMMAKHITTGHIRHWAKQNKLPTWQRPYFEELLAD